MTDKRPWNKRRPWKIAEYLGLDDTWDIWTITEEEYKAGVDKPEGPHFLAIDVYNGTKYPRTYHFRLAPKYEVGALYYLDLVTYGQRVYYRTERGWGPGMDSEVVIPDAEIKSARKVPVLPELTDDEFDAISAEYPEGGATAEDSAYADYDIAFDRVVQAYREARS